MTPPGPLRFAYVGGEVTTRGVTLQLPIDTVRGFLPAGLELGAQSYTESGFHPVLLLFDDIRGVQPSALVPGITLFPGVDYHEHVVGIPFTYISNGSVTHRSTVPYCYMPKLYLDNFIPTAAGVLFWGFAKEFGWIGVRDGLYTVSNLAGRRLTSFLWDTSPSQQHPYQPLVNFPLFTPVRDMLTQPLISLLPFGLGPIFALANYERDFDGAGLKPLYTAVEVDVPYLPGYEQARYPATGWSTSIHEDRLGGYEFTASWRLSMPYPPPR